MYITDSNPTDVRLGTIDCTIGQGIEVDGDTRTGWNRGTARMRCGTASSISGTRKGDKVKLSFVFTRYAAGKGFVPYANRTIALQNATSKSGPWSNVTFVRLDARGSGSVTVTTSRHDYYRVTTGSTPAYWGATSMAIKR